jgi:hypothetical protein
MLIISIAYVIDWRRERNRDPTVSEFVTSNLPEGERLGSNSSIENTKGFQAGLSPGHETVESHLRTVVSVSRH